MISAFTRIVLPRAAARAERHAGLPVTARVAAWTAASAVCLVLLAAGCGGGSSGDGGEEDPAQEALRADVVENYADMMFANYSDVISESEKLKTAITAFIANPSAAGLTAVKDAWLEARPFYQETEVGRFYDGPIDNPQDGPEGRINAWPLDEGYIDYVVGAPAVGIINDPNGFPAIDAATLIQANENGGEANLSLGWHAIEFLAWGQDTSAAGPGNRSHLDFVDNGGTAPPANEARRRQYLAVVMDQLIVDLTLVAEAWDPANPGNFREQFLARPTRDALSSILTGIGTLCGGELRGERLLAAFVNKDQEDEHSCFSDNTHNDHLYDLIGITNVYLGRYQRPDGTVIDGPGIDELVKAADAQLDTRVQNRLTDARQKIEAIPEPFDQAILAAANSPEGQVIQAAINALADLTDDLGDVAAALGVSINTTLP